MTIEWDFLKVVSSQEKAGLIKGFLNTMIS